MDKQFLFVCMCLSLAVSLLLLPFAVYLCAKLGAYGFYRGRALYYQNLRERKTHDNNARPR